MLFTLLHVYIFISRFICRFQETLKNCLIRAVIFCIPSDPSTFFISLNSILIRSRERTIYKPFSWSFPSFSHVSSLVYFFSSSPQRRRGWLCQRETFVYRCFVRSSKAGPKHLWRISPHLHATLSQNPSVLNVDWVHLYFRLRLLVLFLFFLVRLTGW